MSFGPLAVITGLGILGLLVAKKSSAAPAPGAPGSPELPAGPTGPGGAARSSSGAPPFVPGVPAEDDMPASLKEELARALQLLTIDPATGAIVGPVTEDAVRNATALASRLRTLGFPEAAQALEDLAKKAAASIPSPPKDKQAPLPGVSPDLVDQLNRALKLERDPKKLRAIVETLKKLPPSPERDTFIATFEALILQVEAEEAEKEALRKIEDTIKSPDAPKPEPVVPPFVPGPSPTPPSPAAPAPASPTSTRPRVVQVLAGDGLIKITRRLEQPDSRWTELRDRNVPVDADNRRRQKDSGAAGIKPGLQPGQLLFVPESWPVAPGTPIPSPSPAAPAPAPVTPASAPAAGPRTTTVQAGDGFIRISTRLLENSAQGNARWRELRDANVPTDAGGRSRSKDTDAKGGIKPQLNPGDRLFVPTSWPVTTTAGWGISGDAAEMINEVEIEPIGEPKTEAELSASVLVQHLLRLQSRFGIQKARRKADKRHIARFEESADLPATGEVTPECLYQAAWRGESVLPLVMHWPNSTENAILFYKKRLRDIAEIARGRGEAERAQALEASADREGGQAAGFLLVGAGVAPS